MKTSVIDDVKMTTLQDIGERKAIEEIKKILSSQHLCLDIGDDCGGFQLDDNYILVTTDMIAERTHIPSTMNPEDIGWFVVAINLSDLAAKGGRPKGLVLSCGLPKTYPADDYKKILRGAKTCADTYHTAILGGDTKENEILTISGTAVGIVPLNEFMGRYGAKNGDIVAVTGTLGKAAAGWYSMNQLHPQQEIIDGLIHPLPQIRAGRILASTLKVHCCMDISDGLSSSLYQLAKINKVGFEIKQENLPINPMLSELKKQNTQISLPDDAIHFGGDYELLFTTSREDFHLIKENLESIQIQVSNIGMVTESKDIIIRSNHSQRILRNQGYEHFSTKLSSLKEKN